jgi:hypothetical protein
MKDDGQSEENHDLPLRLLFSEFLAACAFTTLARAEDNIQDCVSHPNICNLVMMSLLTHTSFSIIFMFRSTARSSDAL